MTLNGTEEKKEEKQTESWLNLFHATGLFLHPLKTFENL